MAILARRFTIICLILVIFALLMAAAVANTRRATHGWRDGAIDACVYHPALKCMALPAGRSARSKH